MEYKIKEYGFLEKNRDFLTSHTKKEYISYIESDDEKKLALSKLYSSALLALLEEETYFESKRIDEITRFYKLPIIKKSLNKIDLNLYFTKTPTRDYKTIDIVRNSIFDKINFSGGFIKKHWNLEEQQKIIEQKYKLMLDIKRKKKIQSDFIDVSLDMSKIVATPIESLDLVLEHQAKDPEMIAFLYAESQKADDKQSIPKLVAYTRDMFEDNAGKVRENLRKIIKNELYVDAYKYMLKNHMNDLRKIYSGYSDSEIYNDIIEKMIKRLPDGLYMLIHDNKFDSWMDKNLRVAILEKMSNDKPIELALKWNSRNTKWEAGIENLMLLLQDIEKGENNSKISELNGLFDKIGREKYSNIMKNIATNTREYAFVEFSTFIPYAKEIKEITSSLEDILEKDNKVETFGEKVIFKMFNSLYYLSEIFNISKNLNILDPQEYYLEDKIKKIITNLFKPKINIYQNGSTKLNTYVFDLDLKTEPIYANFNNETNSVDISLSKRIAPFINQKLMCDVLNLIKNKSSLFQNIEEIRFNDEKNEISMLINPDFESGDFISKIMPNIFLLIRQEVEIDIEDSYLSNFKNKKQDLLSFIAITEQIRKTDVKIINNDKLTQVLFKLMRIKDELGDAYGYEHKVLHKNMSQSMLFAEHNNFLNLINKIHKIELEARLEDSGIANSEVKVRKKI